VKKTQFKRMAMESTYHSLKYKYYTTLNGLFIPDRYIFFGNTDSFLANNHICMATLQCCQAS